MSDAAPHETGARARALAAKAVSAVIDSARSLDAALADLPSDLVAADRALVHMLAYGVLRDLRRLEAALAPRLSRTPQPLLKALLLVGLFQLEATRVPPHAAVHATVAAAGRLKLGRARGMVNAILRAHQRADSSPTPPALAERYSYPDWLAERIEIDWGESAEAVMAAGNLQAPMHVRVNRRKITPDELRARWAAATIDSEVTAGCADGLTLAEPRATDTLPGFADGLCSVQDGAAQRAADLLAPTDGQRVLDACAAPGNKSAHLLERADIDLLALDIDAQRLVTLKANLSRLSLAARSGVADAVETENWWDEQPFDRILLDAPCSGTGVIRRHPDIKWLRRASDINDAAVRQAALLQALWVTLAPGGRLLYATCSILRAEGVDIVADFLHQQPDARERVIDAAWGEAETHGRRIMPGQHGFDGFYYAVLERTGDTRP